jgi:hypothetical protein
LLDAAGTDAGCQQGQRLLVVGWKLPAGCRQALREGLAKARNPLGSGEMAHPRALAFG